MKKKTKAGIGLATSVASFGLFGFLGARNTLHSYNQELLSDSARAVVAKDFLANQSKVTGQILKLIDGQQAKIDHVAESIGANCMKIVVDKTADTIEELKFKYTCPDSPAEIKEERTLYNNTAARKTFLSGYVQISNPYGLEAGISTAADVAKEVIKDAEDKSFYHDLGDAHYDQAFAILVNGDTVTEVPASDGELSPYRPAGFVLLELAAIAGFAGCVSAFRNKGPRLELLKDAA